MSVLKSIYGLIAHPVHPVNAAFEQGSKLLT
jgi:hypothetical protein